MRPNAGTSLHLADEREAAELFGIPCDELGHAALIPTAHTNGSGSGRQPRAHRSGRARGSVVIGPSRFADREANGTRPG
jgi:hypothetical protein